MLREGKNREVRRLFESFGYEVIRLDRKLYAGLSTRGLARGESRRLERREISALRRLVELE
jgi:23S rRNA pseudouridine2605 synthase